jgi:hypothetical protein
MFNAHFLNTCLIVRQLSKQDSPTAHSANNASSCLQNVFGDEIDSFYWWGHVKG